VLETSQAIGAAPYYLRRVKKHIRAHGHEPVSLADMVNVSGVSARSLHTGFRRFRGATPMKYLKNHRLELAHARLKKGSEAGQTVTDIALGVGFTHLSKFARDYQERRHPPLGHTARPLTEQPVFGNDTLARRSRSLEALRRCKVFLRCAARPGRGTGDDISDGQKEVRADALRSRSWFLARWRRLARDSRMS
jgi:AraC-like DNA-binding protein